MNKFRLFIAGEESVVIEAADSSKAAEQLRKSYKDSGRKAPIITKIKFIGPAPCVVMK